MCAGAQGVKWEVATVFGPSHRPGKEVHGASGLGMGTAG